MHASLTLLMKMLVAEFILEFVLGTITGKTKIQNYNVK